MRPHLLLPWRDFTHATSLLTSLQVGPCLTGVRMALEPASFWLPLLARGTSQAAAYPQLRPHLTAAAAALLAQIVVVGLVKAGTRTLSSIGEPARLLSR